MLCEDLLFLFFCRDSKGAEIICNTLDHKWSVIILAERRELSQPYINTCWNYDLHILHNQLLIQQIFMSQVRTLNESVQNEDYNYYLFMEKSSLFLCILITWNCIWYGVVNLPSCTLKPKVCQSLSVRYRSGGKHCRSTVVLRIQIEPSPWRCWTTMITGLSLTCAAETVSQQHWTSAGPRRESTNMHILSEITYCCCCPLADTNSYIYIFIWQSGWRL